MEMKTVCVHTEINAHTHACTCVYTILERPAKSTLAVVMRLVEENSSFGTNQIFNKILIGTGALNILQNYACASHVLIK